MLKTNGLLFLRSLLFLLIAGSLLTACQPEIEGDVPPPAGVSKPKTYTEILLDGTDTIAAETYNLLYNSNGKLSAMISASDPGNKFLYTYSTSTFVLNLYQANQLSLTANYLLNASGRVDSSFQYIIGTTDTTTEKYTYNSQNQVTSIRYYSNSPTGYTLDEVITVAYDANGNAVKETSSVSGVTTYTYYPNLRNTLQIYPDEALSSPFLVNTTSNPNYTLTHTYLFDSMQRIIEEKAVESSGLVLYKRYTY